MASDDDFTFCQVGVPVSQEIEAKNLAQNIDDIKIKDKKFSSNGSTETSGILWKDKFPDSATSKKEKTIGSLLFKVIDTSTMKKSNEVSRQEASRDAGTHGMNLQEQKILTRKSAPRAKIPFLKGYSQMDWMKLTQTHPDLVGLKGQSNRRLISMIEVKQHQTEGSMWTVLKGRVYNLSPYIKFHPGGVDMLMKAVGKDCTALFNKYHAWVNVEFLLEKCLVGILEDSHLETALNL